MKKGAARAVSTGLGILLYSFLIKDATPNGPDEYDRQEHGMVDQALTWHGIRPALSRHPANCSDCAPTPLFRFAILCFTFFCIMSLSSQLHKKRRSKTESIIM